MQRGLFVQPISLNRLLKAVGDFVLPGTCIGCGMSGTDWCEACDSCFAARPWQVEVQDLACDLGEVSVWVCATYQGPVASLINRAKEQSSAIAQNIMARKLEVCLNHIAHQWAGSFAISVVPIPTSKRAVRARGQDSLRRIATQATSRAGQRFVVNPGLHSHISSVDQASLSINQRVANVAGTFRWRNGAGGSSLKIVLLDDVVTTGATLKSAIDTIAEQGIEVMAAVAVAATRRRVRTPRSV